MRPSYSLNYESYQPPILCSCRHDIGPQPPNGPGNPCLPDADAKSVPTDLSVVPDRLEVTLWATSPKLYNPTNMDIDKDGRIWVAEGVRYRKHFNRQPEGDRIVMIEDTDGDSKADSSHTFVQEELLVPPLESL